MFPTNYVPVKSHYGAIENYINWIIQGSCIGTISRGWEYVRGTYMKKNQTLYIIYKGKSKHN